MADIVKEIVLNDFAEKFNGVTGIVGFDFITNTLRIVVEDESVIELLPPTYYCPTLGVEYGVEFTIYPKPEQE